jgi:hypothetical protein
MTEFTRPELVEISWALADRRNALEHGRRRFIPGSPNDQRFEDQLRVVASAAGRVQKLLVEAFGRAGQVTPSTVSRPCPSCSGRGWMADPSEVARRALEEGAL